MKGIMEIFAANSNTVPSGVIDLYFIFFVSIIIIIAIGVNVRKPKVDFVNEFEMKYGKVNEIRENED